MSSCDCSPGDRITGGLTGTAYAISGFLGLSGLWDPVNDQEYKNQITELQNTQDQWNEYIASKKGELSESINEINTLNTNLMQTTIKLHEDTLEQSIQKNSLEIMILFVLVLIILGYLLLS